jgi:undecaprenyl pyrophosphate phosphatase UppP
MGSSNPTMEAPWPSCVGRTWRRARAWTHTTQPMFLAGSVSSGVVGYLAVRFLLRFLVNHSLRVFAYYRFALAAVVALALLSSGS